MRLPSTLQTWLDELDDEVVLLHSSNLNSEANHNIVTFGISEDNLREWGLESINNFILACRDMYATRTNSIPMQFYCWFDQQAGQLRISAVSSEHNKLPFGCQLNVCDLSEVMQGFLNNNNGLGGEHDKLNVWCCSI